MIKESIYEQWSSLKAVNPSLRALDAASQIGVSEGELVASRVGNDAVRLLADWKTILPAIEKFGEVMALTRNEYCVHERKGPYIDTCIGENNDVGLIVSPHIDLRFLLGCWGSVFAIEDKVSEKVVKDGLLRSIQFFDKQGVAVHKVYLMDNSNKEAWNAFLANFKDPEQVSTLYVEPKPIVDITVSDEQVNVAEFQNSWSELKDTHHFAKLLKDYKLTRTQGLRLVESKWAEPLAVEFLPEIFERASASKQKIMVFVGNEGCVQIHTGLIENLKWVNGWFNVIDSLFNLHLNMEGVADLWRVRKPTTEGVVTSLEAYDSEGNLIVQLFGPRRPGIPELKAWRELAESLPSLEG